MAKILAGPPRDEAGIPVGIGRRTDAQQARTAVTAHVEFEPAIGAAGEHVATRLHGRLEAARHPQFRPRFHHDLAAEHEAAQLRGEVARIGIGQQQPEVLRVHPQQREQRHHAPPRRQPAVPVPMPDGQRGDVPHELRLGESRRVAPGQGQDAVPGQFTQAGGGVGQVVGHGCGT